MFISSLLRKKGRGRAKAGPYTQVPMPGSLRRGLYAWSGNKGRGERGKYGRNTTDVACSARFEEGICDALSGWAHYRAVSEHFVWGCEGEPVYDCGQEWGGKT